MNPELLEMLNQIFELCIIPLLMILSTYAIKYATVKKQEILEDTDNLLYGKYMAMLIDTIISCVEATNQTYVDALKKEGKFDKEAQEIALNKTFDAVMAILSEDAKLYLNNAVGDLHAFIMNKIESSVHEAKQFA